MRISSMKKPNEIDVYRHLAVFFSILLLDKRCTNDFIHSDGRVIVQRECVLFMCILSFCQYCSRKYSKNYIFVLIYGLSSSV